MSATLSTAPPAEAVVDGLSEDLAHAEQLLNRALDRGGADNGERGGCRFELLRRCAATFRLSPAELDVVLLALAVELDARFGALFARVHGDPSRRRPTVASLLDVLTAARREPAPIAMLSHDGHLVRTGLIELSGDGPFPDRIVRLPDVWWPRLAGLPSRAPFRLVAATPGALARLTHAPTTRVELDAVLDRRGSSLVHEGVIVVSGRAGSGRESVAIALVAELGFASLLVGAGIAADPAMAPHLAREAAWNLAALVIQGAPAPGTVARLAGEISTPIAIIADDAAVADEASLGRRWRADVTVAALEPAGREALWRAHLDGATLADGLDLRALAARLPLGPGRIAAAAASARRSRGRKPIDAADLRAACRRSESTSTGLATRIEADASFDELVVPAATRRELELALVWARCGASVFHPTGAGRLMRGRDGLVCLFHGPPGTGKTMAARVMAAAIEADLLRVDLSQVVNKYIGETEKNLERVFDEAEATGAALFFDEADALFGKRSEVKDAHDRYANIETAFLLQRLEAHHGVCILASNLRQNLDEAFTRRIHVMAEFPMPAKDDRRRIWDLQFPAGCLGADVDLTMLADRAALAGGDIRNAAATAALLAAADGGAVSMRHLVIGTWRELRKSGRLVSADVFGAWKEAILDYGRTDGAGERA